MLISPCLLPDYCIFCSLACVNSETHNLQRVFRRILGTKGGHCATRSLRRPWKLGLRIVAWSKPRMFSEESLEKIKFKAFPKSVGSRILSLESVDYLGTSEHFWNALVMSMRFIFRADWNDVPCKSLFWSLAMMLFPWNRGPWISVYLYTRMACDRRRYFWSSPTRVLNQFRNK